MKKSIVIGLVVLGVYFYLSWEPSASKIAREMTVGEAIVYDGVTFSSDWEPEAQEIGAYLRRKDRHFDKNVPILTYDLVLTTGQFNDPEVVKLRDHGGGNYSWRAREKPDGTLIVYHTVPATVAAQTALDQLEAGANVTLIGRISRDSRIGSDAGAFVGLAHDNHKFILVEGAFQN